MTEAKTALVTGTSSGIGNETAKLFQSRGWRVVATARDPQRAQNLAGLPNVLLTLLDVTDAKTINSAVDKALERFERIDVLVNNAGYGSYGPLETYTTEKMRKQFDTNVSELKKKQRDQDSYFAFRTSVTEEFGDVLWYFANIASRANLKLTAIGQRAFRKLGDWDQPSETGSVSFEELQAGVELSGPRVSDIAEASLIGLAGKVGRLLDDVASGRIDGNRDALSAHLVEIFRALIHAANDAGISLADCARKNLEKASGRWPIGAREYAPLFDENEDPEEQLPRHIEMDIAERTSGKRTYVRLQCRGINIGDRLTDNKIEQDDYRFHDVFHLGYAAMLGWSPVIRALFKVKRKSKPLIDETQDGARAVLIEEGVATWIFNHACRLNYFASISSLDYSLLKAIKELVTGYEVEILPLWQWEEAILKGYEVFRSLREHRRGMVIADLRTHSLSFQEGLSEAQIPLLARLNLKPRKTGRRTFLSVC